MSDETKNVGTLTPEQDYVQNFMPSVHKIGRFSMIVAFFLSIAPFCYFYFVKGYQVPFSMILAGIATVSPMLIGGWISEPFTYWPILGSAGTYMAYLSGNVSGMRFPVAAAVQKNMDAPITTPTGQVATIVGLAVSIVANLVILLITVLLGDVIMSALPANILHAFNYCVVAMIGSMLLMRFTMNKKGMGAALVNAIPYIICGVCAWFFANKLVKGISMYGNLIGVGCGMIIAFIRYRMALKKWEEANK